MATLTVIVECCDRDVVEKIIDGITTVARSSNAGERQATILLFSCLINYHDKDDIRNRFTSGFVSFYQMLTDN